MQGHHMQAEKLRMRLLQAVKTLLRDCLVYWRVFFLILMPVICLPLPLIFRTSEAACGYALLIMATYWITEALPLPVTAILPFVLFPLLGIMKGGDVAREYIADTSVVLIGGLVMALAVEKCNLHSRIALRILLMCGTKPVGILIGFMLPTWFLSMWLSNTATTGMMIPVAEQVIEQMTAHSRNKKRPNRFSTIENVSNAFVNGAYKPDCGAITDAESLADEFDARLNGKTTVTTTSCQLEDRPATPDPKDTPTDINPIKSSSNTATDFVTSVESIVDHMEVDAAEVPTEDKEHKEQMEKQLRQFAKMLSLAIAYASNVGGTATLTGTPTNLLVAGKVNSEYLAHGCDAPLTYFAWLLFGLPHAILCLLVAFAWLLFVFQGWRIFCCCCPSLRVNLPQNDEGLKKVFRDAYDKLGPITFAEISVSILFILLVVLWFARDPGFAPGYSSLFKKDYVTDSMPAILVTTLLFIFPSRMPDFMCFRGAHTVKNGKAKRVPALLDWYTVSTKLPWGPIFILGGGFALAEGIDRSGLTSQIGNILKVLQVLPAWTITLLVATLVSFLTEITSNSAVINVVTPILLAMSSDLVINPLYLLLPAAMSASFAFMLPIATPPNAIVFSYGRLRVLDMARTGVVLDLLCVMVVFLGIHTWGWSLFNLGTYPWVTGADLNLTAAETSHH